MKIKSVSGRTPNQKDYIRSINEYDITFCHGPAGSGKTHVAAGMAAWMLAKEKIEKIALCRPVVSVGQDIGFLPGTADEKVGPYLAPLFDELGHYFPLATINQMMMSKHIEIVPLSMMRGRTFNNCFVILDEAQNATEDELRMFLTRVGQNCKMVLAGDSSQSDMPGQAYGRVTRALSHLDEIGIVYLTHQDIVRNKLITKIITALNRANHAPKAHNDFRGYEEDLHEMQDGETTY